jgi:hypothetical protein
MSTMIMIYEASTGLHIFVDELCCSLVSLTSATRSLIAIFANRGFQKCNNALSTFTQI